MCKKNYESNVTLACNIYSKCLYDIQVKDRVKYIRSLSFASGEASKIEHLLIRQNIDCELFAKDVISWLGEKQHKVNSLFLAGVPNSGKSLLATLLSQIFVTKTFNNVDSTSQFLFGNVINAAMIHIEEPFLVPVLLEDFKKLCEGSNMLVNVKFQEPQTLSRTPVIITSNFDNLSHGHAPPLSEKAIKLRCFFYQFKYEFIPSSEIKVCDFISFINKYGQ